MTPHDGFTHESTVNKSVEWYTPPIIFERLGIRFDLDVCSPGVDVLPYIPADRHIVLPEDGLNTFWRGRVWMNPPYGSETINWIAKFNKHHNGIALVFSRTDTRWFQVYASQSDAICFVASRLKFTPNDSSVKVSSAGCGSILLANGADCVEALYHSNLGVMAKFTGEAGQP